MLCCFYRGDTLKLLSLSLFSIFYFFMISLPSYTVHDIILFLNPEKRSEREGENVKRSA
jgi:cell division protein FtsW (lipid II flippase)